MAIKATTGSHEKLAMTVSVNSLLANGLLSAFKFFAGIQGHSGAMVSDAVHSASDVFSTVVVMIGFHMSEKEPDAEHPYGHERLECVAAILLAAALCVTGVGIGMAGIGKVFGYGGALCVPGKLAFTAAVISVAVKEGMYWYTRSAAKKINSSALMADAWHHRSDALSSVGSLIGIAAARFGFPVGDPIAGVLISVLVVRVSCHVFMDAVGKMTDHACGREKEEQMRRIAEGVAGVTQIALLHTRLFGSKIYVDLEIEADGRMPLEEANRIAEKVHDEIERNMQEVKHCMVRVNPAFREKTQADS